MKTPLIIAISSIALGGILGFLIADRKGDNSTSKGINSNHLTTAKSTTRKTTPRKNSAHGATRTLEDTSQRGTTANINNILKLNARGIKDLITGAEFNVLNEGSTPLFNAALSRLTEIDPSMALETLQELSKHQKYTARHAVFKEWSAQDTEGLISMALDGQLLNHKDIALHYALINISLQDPSRALKLATEHHIDTAISTIIINLSKNDPLGALSNLETLVNFKAIGDFGDFGGDSALSRFYKKKCRERIMNEWYLNTPKEASDYIESIKNKQTKSRLLVGLIEAVSTDEAFELLDQNINNIYTSELEKVTTRLVKEKPSQMMAWLENLPEGTNKSKLTSTAIEHWFTIDESEALAYYQSISNKSQQEIIAANLLDRLASDNPKKYMELYPIIGSDKIPDWDIFGVLKKIATTDIAYATEYLNGLTDTKKRSKAIHAIISGVSRKDPEHAILIAEQLVNQTERDIALAGAYEKIAIKDPQKVMNAFKERGMKDIGEFKVTEFVKIYAEHNIEDAQAFVHSIEDHLTWSKSISTLLNVWAKRDPLEALKFALQQEQTKSIEDSILMITKNLATKDPQMALTFSLSLPRISNSSSAISSILYTWMKQDLETAVNVIASLPVNQVNTSLYSSVAKKYSETDAKKGSEWIDSIQDEKAKNTATSTLMRKWIRDDPDSALSWVETMQSGSQRETAVDLVVSRFKYSDPIYAIEWASTLSNESASKSLMRSTYRSWKEQNPQAANNWLKSTNLLDDNDRESW